MLPIIEQPLSECTVPSTGEVIKFRPFLVKEEKILMLASESDEYKEMVNACGQIVTNCTFEKLDVSKIPMFDLQDIFLKIRMASVGSTQTFSMTCGDCEKTTELDVDISEITVKGLDNLPNTEIKASDEIVIKMRFPSALDIVEGEDDMTDIETIKHCIAAVVTEEEEINMQEVSNEDLQEFIENLPMDVFNEMRNFLRGMPVLMHEMKFDCYHCKEPQVVNINGYEHFFG
jgi:hypothetical protein